MMEFLRVILLYIVFILLLLSLKFFWNSLNDVQLWKREGRIRTNFDRRRYPFLPGYTIKEQRNESQGDSLRFPSTPQFSVVFGPRRDR